MATYHFKCSVCNKNVSARSKYYKRYLGRYDCDDEKQLSNRYACRACRKKRGEQISPRKKIAFDLQDYPKFGEIQGYISLEAIKLKQIGLSNEMARQNFLENVRLILAEEEIKQYNFIIENNNLIGVNIKLPIIGNVVMEINLEKEV